MGTSIPQPSAGPGRVIESHPFHPCKLNVNTCEVLRGNAETVPAQALWYAVYTRANHEKRVADQIVGRGMEHFLPQYESVRRWKDRQVTLKLPLFPGYLFVHIALHDQLRLMKIPGVVRLVGFNGQPAPLPDEEMEIMRLGVSRDLRARPHPFLTAGQSVRILSGPFAGLVGLLKRKSRNLRVVVSLNLIQRSIAVDVDASDIVPIT